MKKYAFTLLCCLLLQGSQGLLFGQVFKLMTNTALLAERLKDNAHAVKSISSDFTQEKNMKMLQDKVRSEGKFYFLQPDKIRIEYTRPFQYLLIMAGGNVIIKDGKKTTRMNIRNNKAMQSVNQVLMDCMRGTVFSNPGFISRSWASATQYRISLAPRSADLKKYLTGIDIYINKTDLNVTKLVMNEPNGDHTDMSFSHTKNNIPLPDALFKVH
ncbi:MAG TPA: outer membrane lipoprotein carrier protein LolA [Edaphocola sp.]|nr:outer membrane lipoprotein carrier protein LolA [Edaphocola sp.]